MYINRLANAYGQAYSHGGTFGDSSPPKFIFSSPNFVVPRKKFYIIKTNASRSAKWLDMLKMWGDMSPGVRSIVRTTFICHQGGHHKTHRLKVKFAYKKSWTSHRSSRQTATHRNKLVWFPRATKVWNASKNCCEQRVPLLAVCDLASLTVCKSDKQTFFLFPQLYPAS